MQALLGLCQTTLDARCQQYRSTYGPNVKAFDFLTFDCSTLCVRLAEEKQKPESSCKNDLFSSEDWRRIKGPEKLLLCLSQSLAPQYQHALGDLAFAAGARRQNRCKMHNKNMILGASTAAWGRIQE